MIVKTSAGEVRGVEEDGVRRFLGVPYAAPPYGAGRFAPPRPHEPWEGVRDALSFGASPPQIPYTKGLEKVLPSVVVPGDDMLNVNIWTPSGAEGAPVMVWMYGGGLTRGSNAIATYDGRAFARDGVVLVSVNYRIGAEGFSVLSDAPANLGLADQLAALRWVRENIAAFGGDPARVTVFGQSAGGGTVAALLAHPEASVLMAGAIVMSGPIGPGGGDSGKITELMAADLGIPRTREAFAAVSPEDLLACQTRVMGGATALSGGPGFGGVVGQEPLPVDPGAALLAGAGKDIPLMLGYTAEEARLWLAPTGLKITWLLLLAARLKLKIPRKAVRLYYRNRPGATAGDVFGALVTDLMLRVPKNNLADARSGRTWMYEFAWKSPVLGLGAAHALELGFVFDTLDSADAEAFAGPGRPQALADEMHAAWVRFAATGDPGWAEWDASRPVMTFDSPGSRVVHAPREEERAVLSLTGRR
ncbi:carboxylesterase/lipase family protein [Sinosporangium siamense]|uniref:Carboxylic ester hydrolase n=1 Tax=Sinosporangium siamense TaxID=1367973 RepID=A0A919V501_9ACTN|nr:carboxylesterase family protein [Sinosporangium siamense]GII92460.1 carboxylic ester hydrolase [Sinosporangium siamense]